MKKNIGVYRNIHFLFNKATAPIFMGLCADDYLYEGSLTKIVNEWKTVSPDTAILTFNWEKRQMNHDKLTQFSYSFLPRSLVGVNAMFAFFLFGNIPGNFSEISGKVKQVAPEHFLYHVKFSADYEYWLRQAKRNPIYFSDLDVVYIRRHDKVAATRMITKGEYLEESIEVYENIIKDLSAYCDRRKLIAFYNIQICSYHLGVALKASFRGRFEALKSFLKLRSNIFWPTGIQAIACLPFALSRRLRFSVSSVLAKSILKNWK